MSYNIEKGRRVPTPREAEEMSHYLIKGWAGTWSKWHQVMNLTQIGDEWEERSGVGYRKRPDLVTDIFAHEEGRACGIYEFMAEIRRSQLVVYVGCTCRNDNDVQSLPARINEYCQGGSHLADLINDALTKGYTIYFRYKTAVDNDTATLCEKQLLVKFSYGWNTKTVTGTLPG